MRPSPRRPLALQALTVAASLALGATGCDLVSRLKGLAGGEDAGSDAAVVLADDAAVVVAETPAATLDAGTVAPKVAPVATVKKDGGASDAGATSDAGAAKADAGAAAPADAGIPTPVPTIPIPTIPRFDAGAWKPPGTLTIPRFTPPPPPK